MFKKRLIEYKPNPKKLDCKALEINSKTYLLTDEIPLVEMESFTVADFTLKLSGSGPNLEEKVSRYLDQ